MTVLGKYTTLQLSPIQLRLCNHSKIQTNIISILIDSEVEGKPANITTEKMITLPIYHMHSLYLTR